MESEKWYNLPINLKLSNYQITKFGNIRNFVTKRELSINPSNSGYISKSLITDSKTRKGFMLHVLVATTFIPNPEDKKYVDHINRIRSDNRIENLQYLLFIMFINKFT